LRGGGCGGCGGSGSSGGKGSRKLAAAMTAKKVVGQIVDVGNTFFLHDLFLNRINSLSFDTYQNTIH
jgi:hypothetical protein